MPIVAGADGCPAGWIGIFKDLATGEATPRLAVNAPELLEPPALSVLTIDIPIGLPERGSRACDLEARRRLGIRASSVFPAPVRGVLHADSREQANEIGVRTDGRRLSQQLWAIVPKVREVDALFEVHGGLQDRVREVHPELSFWAWNGGQPMQHPKRSSQGRDDRRQLVERSYPGVFEVVRSSFTKRQVADDDILDACAALWTAERIAAGAAESIPTTIEHDGRGLRMEIVC